MTFEHDLERWEAGELSLPELERAHPGSDAESLVALHERLSTFTTEVVAIDEAVLTGMLATLPDRVTTVRRRGRPRRAMLLAVAAVLLTASVALAMPGVRGGVASLAHGVGHLLSGHDTPVPSQAPPTQTRLPSTSPPGDLGGDGAADGSGSPRASGVGDDGGQGSGGSEHTGDESGGGGIASDGGGGSGDQGDQTGDGGGDQQGGGGGGGDQQGGDTTTSGDQGGSGDTSGDGTSGEAGTDSGSARDQGGGSGD